MHIHGIDPLASDWLISAKQDSYPLIPEGKRG